MPIPIKLQVFEGPMDLLMHLLDKNKIDIYDIPIAEITDQYLSHVRMMEQEDMNAASEFMVMAATLLDIKSRMLLPREEDGEEEEEDPRDELVRRLLEYKMYKYMSEELRERSAAAGMQFFRPQDLPEEVSRYVPPVNYEELIGNRTMQSLQEVFADVLRRKKSRIDPIRSSFGDIKKEEISAVDKELFIRAYLKNHPHTDFRDLLEKETSKEDVIVTFLVILELMKVQKITVTQREIGGPILIDLVQETEREHPQNQPAAYRSDPEITADVPEPEMPEPEAVAADMPEPEEPEPEAVAADVPEPEEPEPEAVAADVLEAEEPEPAEDAEIVPPEPSEPEEPAGDNEEVPEHDEQDVRKGRKHRNSLCVSAADRRKKEKDYRLRRGLWKRRKRIYKGLQGRVSR